MPEIVPPGTHSATTLEVFGLPRVALVPYEVTSARWVRQGTEHIKIVCGGVEIRLEFDDPTKCEACFDWLLICMRSRPRIS